MIILLTMRICSSLREAGENRDQIRPADPHSTYLNSTQDCTYSVNTSLTSLLQPSPKSTSWPQSPCVSLASLDQPSHVNSFSQEVLSVQVRSVFSLISLEALSYLSVFAQAVHSDRRPSCSPSFIQIPPTGQSPTHFNLSQVFSLPFLSSCCP